jgi:hypothetical protein
MCIHPEYDKGNQSATATYTTVFRPIRLTPYKSNISLLADSMAKILSLCNLTSICSDIDEPPIY